VRRGDAPMSERMSTGARGDLLGMVECPASAERGQYATQALGLDGPAESYAQVLARPWLCDPPAPKAAAGGLLATRRTTLTRTDHQPDLPAILTLRLDVEYARRFPSTLPDLLPAHPAQYHRIPLPPAEDACATVRILHDGQPLIDIPVEDA